MSFNVNKVQAGIECPGELQTEVNTNVTITTVCESVTIEDGDQITFVFAGTGPLPPAEDTELDNILSTFSCAAVPLPPLGDSMGIQDDGTYISNTPHTTMNFGSGLTAVDAGDGRATISADAGAQQDFATVFVGRTTNDSIGLLWSNVPWQVTHLENDTAILEHDNVNTERILIKETGLYDIRFNMSFDADAGEETIDARVLIDDTTVVPGSMRTASEDDEINDLSNAFTALLTTGTYLTFQTQASGLGNDLESSSNFVVVRAASDKGEKGDKGDTGAGSNISLEDDGTPVAGGPFDTLNFAGTNIDVTDAGAGQADIEVIYGSHFQVAESVSVSTTTSTTFQNKATLNTTSLPAGTYRIVFAYSWNHDETDSDFEARFREDAVDLGEIHKQEPKDSGGTFGTTGTSQRHVASKKFYRTLTAGTYAYTLDFRTDSGGDASSIWEATIELIRVS